MKNIKLSLLGLLLIFPLFLSSGFAEDYTRWDLPEGAISRLGKGSVESLMFSPDGNRLIVESSIGLWIYDTHTGVELDFIALGTSTFIRVSPDTRTYISLGSDGTVQVRDLTTNSVKVILKADADDFRRAAYWADRVAFSADSQMLACGVGEEVHLWALTTGEQKATFSGHTDSVSEVAFSPDGTTLASRGYDNTLRLWDVPTATHKTTLSEYADGYYSLFFSRDGSKLAGADGSTIVLWDVATGKHQRLMASSSIYSMALSPDGSTVAGGGYEGLHLWNTVDGTYIGELPGHLEGIDGIAFSPDGTTLASGGGDALFLWDVKSGARKLSIKGHTLGVAAIAFSPDGNTLATTSREEIHLWDPATAEYKAVLHLKDWSFNSSLAFSPDGNILAGHSYTELFLWDVSRGTYITALKGHGGDRLYTSWGFSEVIFSPDGQFLAGANDTSTAVHIWRSGRTHTAAFIGHTAGVTSIDLSQDSRILVSGSHDGTVRLWDVASSNQIRLFAGHTANVYDVAFNPDDSIVASGSEDNTIILWDVATQESRVIHTGYTNGVGSLAFSIDGRTLVSSGGSYDTSLRFWDVATGDLKLTRTGHRYSVRNVVFSPDGKTLASGSWDGTVLLWDATTFSDGPVDPVQHAEDVNRDGVVDLQDLIFVAFQFGQSAQENNADVNADGIVNIEDILLVAAALENGNGAPSSSSHAIELLTAVEVQNWLSQARQVSSNPPTFQKGIAMLEQLLTVLIPKKTVLLPNYPNPFNPETWIPYQLANSVDVTLRIYSATGHLVRVLKLGYQPAGIYQNRSRAAYWDGKNERGEPVASGVYFYTLSADDVTATRRMVIRK